MLIYDLYGRGYSDRPKTKYDETLFINQLSDLLNSLELGANPFYLVGLSMGGAIAATFTLMYPNLIKKLILLAPAGIPWKTDIRLQLLRIPILGRFLFNKSINQTLLEGLKTDFSNTPADYENFKARYMVQMKYKGFKDAIFSTIRNFPMQSLEPTYQALKSLGIPILLLWGEEDNVLPHSNGLIIQNLSGCKFVSLKNTGHAMQYQNPEQVNKEILSFLKLL